MPTYDYLCSTCGASFELVQSFSENALTKCPNKKSGNGPAECASPGRGKVIKVFSAPGISFKGSGFYKTDSRSSSVSASSTSTSSNGSDSKGTDNGSKKETKKKPATTAAKDSSSSTSS